MANVFHGLGPGRKVPEIINVIVEIPKGSKNKYELDKNDGLFKLNRVLYAPFTYNAEYGVIPKTLWDDGDALDVLVLIDQPTFPGCVIEARPLGILEMQDAGVSDAKILAVPIADPSAVQIKELKDVNNALLDEIAMFFEHYKKLQGISSKVLGWKGKKAAKKAIERAVKLYSKKG